MTFHEAIDLILLGHVQYNYESHLSNEEICWLEYLQKVMKEAPQIIKESRGIGAWNNPQIVIIVREIQTPKGFAREGTKGEYGHPWWNELGTYRRLRPFMESKKALKFFYSLMSACPKISFENTYVTTYKKSWVISKEESDDLFWSEIKSLNKPKIVLDLGCSILKVKDNCNRDNWISVEWPTYYSKTHNLEWQQFRYRFCEMICEKV